MVCSGGACRELVSALGPSLIDVSSVEGSSFFCESSFVGLRAETRSFADGIGSWSSGRVRSGVGLEVSLSVIQDVG